MIPTGTFFILLNCSEVIKKILFFYILCIVLSNGSSPSVLEEKCSKNEHDAVPVGLCGKGPQNPQAEHSEDISVVATQCSLYIFG